jgi:hypothetical protein
MFAVLFEAFIVGCYFSLCSLVVSRFVQNLYVLFFVTGFIKHFLSFFIGIQSYYCNYGNACRKIRDGQVQDQLPRRELRAKYTCNTSTSRLFLDSIGEGFFTVLFGICLSVFIKRRIVLFFFIGVFFHLLFEFLGIHRRFCLEQCKKEGSHH